MPATAAITGFVTGAGLIVAIGAQNAYVLRQGLSRRYVGPIVAFCACSDIMLILLGVAGAGVLVQAWPQVIVLFRYAGAAFLVAYGAMAARRCLRGSGHLSVADGKNGGLRRVLLTCAVFTFLNPHAYLDTMVLLGGLSTRYPGEMRWAFGAGACLASVCWFLCLGFGARLLQPVFRKPQAWRLLDGAIAVFMWLLALLLVWQPLTD